MPLLLADQPCSSETTMAKPEDLFIASINKVAECRDELRAAVDEVAETRRLRDAASLAYQAADSADEAADEAALKVCLDVCLDASRTFNNASERERRAELALLLALADHAVVAAASAPRPALVDAGANGGAKVIGGSL